VLEQPKKREGSHQGTCFKREPRGRRVDKLKERDAGWLKGEEAGSGHYSWKNLARLMGRGKKKMEKILF